MMTKPLEEPTTIVGSGEKPPSAAMQDRFSQEATDLLKQAGESEPPLREQLYMKAAEYFLLAGRTAEAAQASQQIEPATLQELDAFRYRLLSAEIDIKRSALDRAIDTLQLTPPMGTEKELLLRFYTDRAVAYYESGKMLESAKARIELDTLIDDPELKTANQLKIIKSLSTLSDTALELLQPKPPDELSGWMELARIFKRHGEDFVAARPEFEAWKTRFPNHPAGDHIYARHYGNVEARQYQKLAQIGVLLPESGPMEKWADAIRKGIKAAHMALPGENRPQLRFYDSSNPQDIPMLYQRAVSEGASAIIGPLDKTAVTVLATGGNLPVPTLAMNQVSMEMAPPANLYQFSLSPEDEASQAAERAMADGFTQAIALVPEGAWGTRVLDAFKSQLTALGGRLSEYQVYDPNKHDFSVQIKSLLNLDESVAREKRLQRAISRKLAFEPSRRRDAEFIFLAADPVLARQIRPQLQFHHAGDLAIYSTSRVFSGVVNPRADQDLNGIRFPDAPWLLDSDSGPLSRRTVASEFPLSQNHFPRLYAMGIDSYNLLGQLERLNDGKPDEMMEGKTGKLYLDRYGLVHRQMIWAEITNGKPNVIGYAPRSKPGNSIDNTPGRYSAPPSSAVIPSLNF